LDLSSLTAQNIRTSNYPLLFSSILEATKFCVVHFFMVKAYRMSYREKFAWWKICLCSIYLNFFFKIQKIWKHDLFEIDQPIYTCWRLTVQLNNNIHGRKIQGSSVTSSWALHNDYWALRVFGAVITYTSNKSPEKKCNY
jgi:hypothetical protein